jgi:hypothetical protein
MQQILNSKDRNEAFLKFLLLFVITVVLVVVAVYFDYRLPVSENKVLLDEVNVQRQQDVDQAKFAAKMAEVMVLLDSMDKPGANPAQLEQQLGGMLSDLNVLQLKENTAYGKIDKAVVDRLSELETRKKQMASLKDKADRTDAAENKVGQLNEQINMLQQTLATYEHKSP